MGKKERKHHKKKSNRRSNGSNKGRINEQPKSTACDFETSQPIDGVTSIPINVSINIQSNANGSSWSWGSAFAAASTIRPNDADLDEDFLQRIKASDANEDGGVSSVAQLAKVYNSNEPADATAEKHSDEQSNKSEDDISNPPIDSDEIPLEGRLIALSKESNEESMVLVDKQSGKVYSSGARLKNGNRIVIGKIKKGAIKLDQDAIKQMKKLEGEEADSNESGPSFPYPTNPDDHCETPLESYQDIAPILDELSKAKGGKSKLRIYDPYYCNGSVVNHLESLGYEDVYNCKEDCYSVWEANKVPEFDVLLTNPPYSEDHIEKLMKYLTSPSFGAKPFMLLMPQWVHKKDYYISATTGAPNDKKRKRDSVSSNQCNPFYIVPKKRYVYLPPPDFREKKASDVHKKSSPFTSMWFIWGGNVEINEKLMDAFRRSGMKGCEMARTKSALRDLRRGGKKKAKIGN